MRWLLTFSVLALGTAMGMVLSSSLRAYTDPHHAAFLLGAAGRTRPPGALLRLRKDAPIGRYAATGAMRGVQLRKGGRANPKAQASQGAAIIPFVPGTMSPVPTQIKAASCGCGA